MRHDQKERRRRRVVRKEGGAEEEGYMVGGECSRPIILCSK
jgi:hypothetical protein